LENCLYIDDIFYQHKPWFPHPESPARLRKLLVSLDEYMLAEYFEKRSPRLGREAYKLALMIHSEEYVSMVEKASEKGYTMLDPDTYVSKATYRAALAVLASVEDAVNSISRGECRLAFIAGRPPGHHAGRNGAAMGAPTLGFCIFNGSALASKMLSLRGHTVLHVDFDLHHGNGTQEILYRDKNVIHVDFHQDPSTIYPGTGWPWQVGDGPARGTKLNIVLPPGTGDDLFGRALERVVELLSDILAWKPDFIVFSAGFDGYQGDGLGGLRLTSNSYYLLAERLREMFRVPVIVVWEGGYSIGLERGVPAFTAGLLGLENPVKDAATETRPTVREIFEKYFKEVLAHLGL